MAVTDLWTYRDKALTGLDLTGYEVEATDGPIGKIDMATHDVGASYIVVDTGVWNAIGKRVVLPAAAIERVGSARVFLNRSQKEIRDAPPFDGKGGFEGRERAHARQLLPRTLLRPGAVGGGGRQVAARRGAATSSTKRRKTLGVEGRSSMTQGPASPRRRRSAYASARPGRYRPVSSSERTTQITWPDFTGSPGRTASSLTTPSRWAAISFSIFIASTTQRTWPAVTSSPSATSTASTVPCIGLTTASAPPAAPRRPALSPPPRELGVGRLGNERPHLEPPPVDLDTRRRAPAGVRPSRTATLVVR